MRPDGRGETNDVRVVKVVFASQATPEYWYQSLPYVTPLGMRPPRDLHHPHEVGRAGGYPDRLGEERLERRVPLEFVEYAIARNTAIWGEEPVIHFHDDLHLGPITGIAR